MTEEEYTNLSNLLLIRAALRVLPAPMLFSAENEEIVRGAHIALNKVADSLETPSPAGVEPDGETGPVKIVTMADAIADVEKRTGRKVVSSSLKGNTMTFWLEGTIETVELNFSFTAEDEASAESTIPCTQCDICAEVTQVGEHHVCGGKS